MTDTQELIGAARSGSLDALGELYRRYADAVHTLAFRVTGSSDDASDVLQDVFVGLPRALKSYAERGRFLEWLKQLTVRTALMRMRRTRTRSETALTEEITQVHTAAAHHVERIAVERALAKLPEQLRLPFVLREIEGYTHAEIAGLLGISAGNSATRLSRAWALLRKELQS